MKVEIKQSVSGEFAKKGEDINDGDVIKFLDKGKEVEGKFGAQRVFKIETVDGDEKLVSVNQTSINCLIPKYGDDTEKWIGKEIKVWINRENVAGQRRKVLYLTHPDVKDLEEVDEGNKALDEMSESEE